MGSRNETAHQGEGRFFVGECSGHLPADSLAQA